MSFIILVLQKVTVLLHFHKFFQIKKTIFKRFICHMLRLEINQPFILSAIRKVIQKLHNQHFETALELQIACMDNMNVCRGNGRLRGSRSACIAHVICLSSAAIIPQVMTEQTCILPELSTLSLFMERDLKHLVHLSVLTKESLETVNHSCIHHRNQFKKCPNKPNILQECSKGKKQAKPVSLPD